MLNGTDRLCAELLLAGHDPIGWQRFAPYEILVRHVEAQLTKNPRPNKKRTAPPALPAASSNDVPPLPDAEQVVCVFSNMAVGLGSFHDNELCHDRMGWVPWKAWKAWHHQWKLP